MFATCNMYSLKYHCNKLPATGHVYDISIPESFMYNCYRVHT